MKTTELLNLAVNNLRESTEKLLQIAQQPNYSNTETPEVKKLFESIKKQFNNCLELKALHQYITNGKSIS